MISKCWKYPEHIEYSPELLKLTNSRVIAQLLANRGIIDPDEAKLFLNISENQFSSPFEFEDLPKALYRIKQAVDNNEHIVIYGDFDADGITSTSILLKTLRIIGANVSYYVPERVAEGYGMNSASVLRLISSRQVKLIITTDCGISNIEEISLAKNFNVDVIITDHHELPDILPPAYAIINPKMLLSGSRMLNLCGAGVAYKVATAILEQYDNLDYLDEIIYLAAIGTIADMVPLNLENRLLTYLGLKCIIDKKPLAILEIAKVAQLTIDDYFSSESIAFTIAPRLNAIGRLDKASIAVELLTSENPEIVQDLTKQLENINRTRQQLCATAYEEAVLMLKDVDLNASNAIVLASKQWHPGIIGIVASDLVEAFYKPTFLIAIDGDEAKGSARSIKGLHLFNVMSKIKDIFIRYGGHELAAGFNLSLSNLDRFKELIIYEIDNELHNTILEPCLNIEMDIEPEELNLELIEELNKLAPFGLGNPAPTLSCSNLGIIDVKTMGSENNHLKINFKSTGNSFFEAVWWQQSSLKIDASEPVKIAFSPKINTYKSKTRMQLVLKDIRPMSETDPSTIKPKNTIKWLDHRQKTNITKLFNSYLKTNHSNCAVFAESQSYIDHVKINCTIINRLVTDNYMQVVLFEYPPDESVLADIITNASPEFVHLSPTVSFKSFNEKDIIKNVTGMLKYASSNKNGEADISLMAAKLGTSLKVITTAIDLLIAANIVELISYKENIIRFRIQSSSGKDITNLPELSLLKTELLKVESFRNALKNKPIEEFSSL